MAMYKVLSLITLISFSHINSLIFIDDVWNLVNEVKDHVDNVIGTVVDIKGTADAIIKLDGGMPLITYIKSIKSVSDSISWGDIANVLTFVTNIDGAAKDIINLAGTTPIGSSIRDIADNANIVPGILSAVEKISVEDITQILIGINKLLIDIPDLITRMADETMWKINARTEVEINDLGTTLKQCFIDIKNIASDLGVLDSKHAGTTANDIENTIMNELATFLLPMKTAIEFACDGKAGKLIQIFKDLFKTTVGITEPSGPPPTRECKPFCKPIKPVYPSGAYYELLMFPLNIDLYSGDDVPAVVPDLKSFTDSNAYMQLKLILTVFKELFYWTENICELFTACEDPLNIIGCVSQSICTVTSKPLGTLVNVIEFLLETADIHDGMIETTMINALFIDRENIIDNQLQLKKQLDTIQSYMGISPKKSVILTTNKPSVSGAYVTIDPQTKATGDVQISNDEWVINPDTTTSTQQIGWPMVVHLTNKWGFSSDKKSILTFKIYGTSAVSGVDSDMVVAFSVNGNEFVSSLTQMDNKELNRIAPQCDTKSKPTATLYAYNIEDIVETSSGSYLSSKTAPDGGFNSLWMPQYEFPTNNGYRKEDNGWPMIFIIENDPIANTMIISLTNENRMDVQRCRFGQAYTSNKGIDVYIGTDRGDVEPIKIKQFEISLELTEPDLDFGSMHMVNINNGDYDIHFYYLCAAVFVACFAMCNISIYCIFKLFKDNKGIQYKSVSYDTSDR